MNKLKLILIMFLIVLAIIFLFNNDENKQKDIKNIKLNEKYYQTKFCLKLGGRIEYRLEDATRVDCLTDEYAIEVDWAKKWAEGIGQSLHYGLMTKRKPAVALIVGKKDKRYLKRLERIAKEVNIKIFLITKIENVK
jgi:hypothetical protein